MDSKYRKQTKKGLLDYIAYKMGADYLSDLRETGYSCDCVRTVSMIEAEEYSVEEWLDAMKYIIGTSQTFENAEAARACLLRCLKEDSPS